MTPDTIKALLGIRRVKQSTIADEHDWSESLVSMVISGERDNPEVRAAIAAAVGAPVAEVFNDEFDAVVAYRRMKTA